MPLPAGGALDSCGSSLLARLDSGHCSRLEANVATRTRQPRRGWRPSLALRRIPPEIAGAGAPTLLLSHGASFDASLTQALFDPSGRRSVDQLAAAVSTGRQPSRGALPQLIPDGLPPEVHLKVALSIRHPFCAAPSCTVAVRYSIKHTIDSAASMVERRARVCPAIEALATASTTRTT